VQAFERDIVPPLGPDEAPGKSAEARAGKATERHQAKALASRHRVLVRGAIAQTCRAALVKQEIADGDACDQAGRSADQAVRLDALADFQPGQ